MYHHSAITCDAPTIIDGDDNCDADLTAWDETCTATCNTGFHLDGDAIMTCNLANSDGIGSFDSTPTCKGMILLFTMSNVPDRGWL